MLLKEKNLSPSEGSKESTETEARAAADDVFKNGYKTYELGVVKYGYNTSEDDVAKYEYNTYEGDEQKSRFETPANNQRMPRRSSLKGGSGAPRKFRRNSLTFTSDVVVTTITPTPELADPKSLWFDEEDYNKMHQKIHIIAESAHDGGKEHRYCIRGLEKMLEPGTQARKHAAWDAVLYEQQTQILSGAEFFDDDALSRSYQKACEESRAEAAWRGQQDENSVKKYLSETRFYCRRMSM